MSKCKYRFLIFSVKPSQAPLFASQDLQRVTVYNSASLYALAFCLAFGLILIDIISVGLLWSVTFFSY